MKPNHLGAVKEPGAASDPSSPAEPIGPNPLAGLRRHILRPRMVVPIAIALVAMLLALRALLGISPGVVWAEVSDANPLLLALAVGVFYITFPVRALRWRVLLVNAGHRDLPSVGSLTRMMVLGSFANSISVAQLGDLYRGYLLKREARVSLPMTLGTILAERVVDLVTLVSLLTAAALTVYSGRLPQLGLEALLAGLGLGLAGMTGLLLLPRSHRLVQRFVPARWHNAYERFEHGAVRSLDRLPLLIWYSALGWLIEGATLLLLAAAIGVDLSATGALVTGLVASLLSVEPLTPGGLGVTEPGIVVVLTSLGTASSAASAIALLNRLVNYASLAVAGGVLYLIQANSRLSTRSLASKTIVAPQ